MTLAVVDGTKPLVYTVLPSNRKLELPTVVPEELYKIDDVNPKVGVFVVIVEYVRAPVLEFQ